MLYYKTRWRSTTWTLKRCSSVCCSSVLPSYHLLYGNVCKGQQRNLRCTLMGCQPQRKKTSVCELNTETKRDLGRSKHWKKYSCSFKCCPKFANRFSYGSIFSPKISEWIMKIISLNLLKSSSWAHEQKTETVWVTSLQQVINWSCKAKN